MKLFSTRLSNLCLLGLICLLLASSYYVEYVLQILPCPLCLLQRYSLMILIVIYALAAMVAKFSKVTALIFNFFGIIVILLGGGLAARQVWLQHLPTATLGDNCGASFYYLLKVLPWDQVLKNTIQGSVDCAEVNWRLFGLSLAEWSLIGFLLLFVLAVLQLCFHGRKRNAKLL